MDRRYVMERTLDVLERALRENVVFTDLLKEKYNREEIAAAVLSCKTFVIFIGQEFFTDDALEGEHDRMRLEIELALQHHLRIVPVLLPGVPVPSSEQLPRPLRPLLGFTFSLVRDDPDYVADIEELISYCRSSTRPLIGMDVLSFPHRLPLHSTSAVSTICGSAHFIRKVMFAIASGDRKPEDLSREDQRALDMANEVLNRWGIYFRLLQA